MHAKIGSSYIDIGRLLQVGRGGVIPLDQSENDMVSLVAGNIVVAKGVLEIQDQRYVIRIHKVLYSVKKAS